eukprot:126986-Chlamydomonas_euryale.AAC.1
MDRFETCHGRIRNLPWKTTAACCPPALSPFPTPPPVFPDCLPPSFQAGATPTRASGCPP